MDAITKSSDTTPMLLQSASGSSSNPEMHLDNSIVYKMRIRDVVKLMEDYSISCFYRRIYAHVSRSGSQKAPSRGSDGWVCRNYGYPQPKTTPVEEISERYTHDTDSDKTDNQETNAKQRKTRNRISRKCGCGASFRIKFPNGYEHMSDKNKSINVKQFGDMVATVTWNSTHNHALDPQMMFTKYKLSEVDKNGSEFAAIALGAQWKNIKQMQQETYNRPGSESMNLVLQNVYYNIRYSADSKDLSALVAKNWTVEKSMRDWARCITVMGGFAEYTEKFAALHDPLLNEDLKSAKGAKAWSFIFMTEWQTKFLSKNADILYLDSTPKICSGLYKGEEVFLFTISVKNIVTDRDAPVAFMLTNLGTAPIIAHFLRKVQSHCFFEPSQAVTDGDTAKSAALQSVWGSDFTISHFYGNAEELRENEYISMATPGNETTGVIDAYRRVLKSRYLRISATERPEVLIFKLITCVVQTYEGKERVYPSNSADTTIDIAESEAIVEALGATEKELGSMVHVLFDGNFSVDSFNDQISSYQVRMLRAGQDQDSCTCPLFSQNGSRCKHLYLVARWWRFFSGTELDQPNWKTTENESISEKMRAIESQNAQDGMQPELHSSHSNCGSSNSAYPSSQRIDYQWMAPEYDVTPINDAGNQNVAFGNNNTIRGHRQQLVSGTSNGGRHLSGVRKNSPNFFRELSVVPSRATMGNPEMSRYMMTMIPNNLQAPVNVNRRKRAQLAWRKKKQESRQKKAQDEGPKKRQDRRRMPRWLYYRLRSQAKKRRSGCYD